MIRRFLSDEAGLETVEYAVMVALIVAGLIAIVVALGDAVGNKFTQVTDEIQSNGQ